MRLLLWLHNPLTYLLPFIPDQSVSGPSQRTPNSATYYWNLYNAKGCVFLCCFVLFVLCFFSPGTRYLIVFRKPLATSRERTTNNSNKKSVISVEFVQMSSCKKSPDWPKLLSNENDGDHWAAGNNKWIRIIFSSPVPICVLIQFCLWGLKTVLLPSRISFLLWYALGGINPHLDRCVL